MCFTLCYILISSNLCMTIASSSLVQRSGYSSWTSSYNLSSSSSLTGCDIRLTSVCLYYNYNTCVCICQAVCLHSVTMYRNRWRASRTSLRGETRSQLRCSLAGHVPIWQPSAAAGKKSEAEGRAAGLPYPNGG